VAIEHPARRALVDAQDDRRGVTYAELRQEILSRAQYFLDRGLRPGNLTVLNMEGADRIDDLLAFLAMTCIGVGVYASSMSSDVERQVAERLEIGHEIVSVPTTQTPRTSIVVPRYEEFRKRPGTNTVNDPTVADALGLPWLVRSTSGTTGEPKVFITTHELGISRRERYYSATGLASDSVFLTLTSIRFGAARQRVFYALSQGASVVIQPEDVTLESVIETARKHRVTHLYCVPMHLTRCCQFARLIGERLGPRPLLPNLVNLESSSSVVSPELARSVRSLISPGFSNSYAASEVGHVSSTRLCTEAEAEEDEAVSNIGKPVEGVEIAIVDERLTPVPTGTRGLIAVRFTSRPTQVAYLDSRRQWVSETKRGYFLPGDIGYFSQTGNLIFECRADDMMICDGINIYPREIESVLEAHPAVAEAAAFPVSSAVHGSMPVAAVTLRSGLSEGPELFEYCRLRLGIRAPHHVAVMAALPRNHLGKILKRELSAMFREA
jgi:acyl-coenzyme A synthetase/AMP-(fatty) acid ligase